MTEVIRKVVQQGSYEVGALFHSNNQWYKVITVVPASEETEEVRAIPVED